MKQLTVAGLVALGTIGVLAVTMTTVRAGPKAGRRGHAFVVTSVTPDRNQEVLPDLSDPGVMGRVTLRFSAVVEAADLVDPQDPAGALTANCRLVDTAFATVPATGSVYRNVLSIDPFSPAHTFLATGRYTVTLKSSIRSARGRLLNGGDADFTTSFLVGSDVYAPVLRGTSPPDGATDVGVRRSVVLTFDEPVDAASAAASIRLEDRRTVPATPIPARVRLARHGFDVVVAAQARAGLPRGTDVTLVVSGRGTATDPSAAVLTDMVGHAFTRDAGPQWTADPVVPTLFHSGLGEFDDVTGEFTMTFRTKGAAPSDR